MNRIVVTGYAAVFLVLIPVLEISDTHLLNEDWPGHARLHEAWQLLAKQHDRRYGATSSGEKGVPLRLCSFACRCHCLSLIAWALQGTYGGSMLHGRNPDCDLRYQRGRPDRGTPVACNAGSAPA